MTGDVPAIVVRAANLSAGDHAGIVGYRILQRSAVDGGPIHRREEVELAVIFDGPVLIKVRVFRHVTNGTASSDGDNLALASRLEHASAGVGFAVPFDRRHLNEYAYMVTGSTVRFRPQRANATHAGGEFTLDSLGHVTEMTYTPSTLPRYAKRGRIAIQRGEVLPGFWASIREEQKYTGAIGFIKGAAEVNIQQSHFHQYATRESAAAALLAGTI